MIKSLEIRNIALISSLSLEFDQGMTVLSGETGSGKSIIIDSLTFVLGERADKSLIKHGEDRAFVEVVFEVEQDSPTVSALEELGFEPETTVVVSRSMTLAGKNECRINGRLCSASMLKTVSATLVDVFGQSQHLNLLRVENQLDVLDGFCNFGNDSEKLAELYQKYLSIKRQLADFGGNDAERARQIDVLNFQINELRGANLDPNEEENLLAEHKKMVNIEKIAASLTVANDSLSDDGGALAFLARAHSALVSIGQYDDQLRTLDDRLNSARIEIDDIFYSLRDALAATDFDESDVDRIESRLERIRSIKRKYGGSIQAALEFLSNAENEADRLSNATALIERLNDELAKTLAEMFDLSVALSNERHATAKRLAKQIEGQLSDLGMKGAEFLVEFQAAPTLDDFEKFVTPIGFDKLEFMFSANVGEPCKPLAKVISGGEMSRFMLAIKNITAKIENIPTMVFDEIDTGISGSIARMVAQKLASVSRDYQTIVITHLPQIASMGDKNVLITKYAEGGKTVSSANLLDEKEKINEIARLMGGEGQNSVAAAAEIVDWANQYKSKLA